MAMNPGTNEITFTVFQKQKGNEINHQEFNKNSGEDDSSSASRGNWWQGMKYDIFWNSKRIPICIALADFLFKYLFWQVLSIIKRSLPMACELYIY
ncbi:unnamed protein product [Ilex paraguariensis]|uniref:Uncharacterized protein n=1 Tax=Ilex paraguariensis TaxID=185542 RepID=A0ABC8QZG8_9AQUA